MQPADGGKIHSLNPSLKLVRRPDDVTFGDEGKLKAEMSCGHAFSPQTITQHCNQQLQTGSFSCPVCEKKWSYIEVRNAGLLNEEERRTFETHIGVISARKRMDIKYCPKCKSLVQRKNEDNLCVRCVICTKEDGEDFYFCWKCLNNWEGPYPRSDRCNNEQCMDPKVKLLLNCKEITLHRVDGAKCPSMRACPNCWEIVQHDQTKCKNIICPKCKTEFCFICLKFTSDCCRNNDWFKMCPSGLAPRQTSIGSMSQPAQPAPSDQPAQLAMAGLLIQQQNSSAQSCSLM